MPQCQRLSDKRLQQHQQTDTQSYAHVRTNFVNRVTFRNASMYFFFFIHDYIRRKAALSSGTSEDKMGAEYLDRAQRDELLHDNKDGSHI